MWCWCFQSRVARSVSLSLKELASPSRLFWCYYENSTCSLWSWHCFQGGCLPWCASTGNACGEGMIGRERRVNGQWAKQGQEDLANKGKEDTGVCVQWRVTEKERERRQNDGEGDRNHSRHELVWPLSTTQWITKPSLHRKETKPGTQMDRTTCKGKTQTAETLHTQIPCMNSLLVCSEAERQHCLFHCHLLRNLCHCPTWKQTYTEVTVFIYGVTWGYFVSLYALVI